MEVTIATLTLRQFGLNIEPTTTVAEIKKMIRQREGIPVQYQRLVFKGVHMAEDDSQAQEYNVEEGSVIQLVYKLIGG